MSRKILWFVLSGLVILGMVTVAVAATPTPPESNFESEDPTTLYNIVSANDMYTFDPAWNYESTGNTIISNVYEQLVTYNRGDVTSFVPALAERWDISEDGMTYVFHIRRDIKFHNGADLTPEDVAYSFRRGLLQGGDRSPQWMYTEPFFGTGVYDISEVVAERVGLEDRTAFVDAPRTLETTDPAALVTTCKMVMDAVQYDEEDWTVTFNLSQAWRPFLSTLTQSWASVLDKDWAVENGAWDGDCSTWQYYYGITSETTPLYDVMNGTGPYMFDHRTPGEETVLVRNQNYWREEQNVPMFEGGPTGASIERVVFKQVSDWETRYAMLQAGDADFVYVPREDFTRVDSMVGERCEWDSRSFTCRVTNEKAPLRLFVGMPDTSRTDVFFVFDINVERENPYIGSGELDGKGIPSNFFDDVHVRKAFNYCFDWETYVGSASTGETVQNVGYSIPGMTSYDYESNTPTYTYDPEMCARELQQAWNGEVWQKGFHMQIGYDANNDTHRRIAQILQTNFQRIAPKFNIEVIGLPQYSFQTAISAKQLPLYISDWQGDVRDPHNWAQPFLVGTYTTRQNMPNWMREEFQELVSAGVTAPTSEERVSIYQQLTALDYEYSPAIRLAVATGRHYELRWMSGYYYDPIYGTDSRYFTTTKQ